MIDVPLVQWVPHGPLGPWWWPVTAVDGRHPKGAHPWVTAGPLRKAGTPMWKKRRLPSRREGMGTQQAATMACRPPHTENVVHLLSILAARLRLGTPTVSVTHILQKLAVIFGTVVSFDVLMQNLRKVTQGNHEKVPYFAMRLEGTSTKLGCNAPGGWGI